MMIGSLRTPIKTVESHHPAAARGVAETDGWSSTRPRSRRPDWHHLRAEEWHPVGDASAGVGLWIGRDLLGRLRDWQEAGVWDRLHRTLLDELSEADQMDWERTCLASTSIPTTTGNLPRGRIQRIAANQARNATVCSNRRGTPLTCHLTGANQHDSDVFEQVVDAMPPIRCPRGQHQTRPAKLHADTVDDIPRCRAALPRCHVNVRKGVESSTKPGRHRGVVEWTLSWLGQFQCLKVRYERRDEIHQAFLSLGCAIICLRAVERHC
jgi:transposase